MRFGISHMIPLIFICLNFQPSYSQATRVTEFKTSTFQGRECDDTEYRNDWGRPNWKNYGEWLSECDSLSDTYYDSVFAVQSAEKQERERLEREAMLAEPLEELDLDAMWENTVWNEIEDIQEDITYETEYITAVAGVRGAEAEDEALHHLYYRRSMKGIALIDLQKAYGKLQNTKDNLIKKDPNHPKLEKINNLLSQLKIKIKNT